MANEKEHRAFFAAMDAAIAALRKAKFAVSTYDYGLAKGELAKANAGIGTATVVLGKVL